MKSDQMYEVPLSRLNELTEEIKRLRAENHRLATTVLMLTYDAHPVYPNTAGPRGGIGGQAMTGWCNVIYGGQTDADSIWGLGIHTTDAREVLKREEFDFQKMKNDLMDEWRGQL